MSDTVTIKVNGREVEADPTKPLIAACHDSGEEVPHYCYHPGLSPVGSCRICQVSVKVGEMPARVVVACRTPITPGMEVDTEAPKAHDARKECLEFLLKNHPLDCPICDKAGECTLQDYSFDEGQGEGRSVEPRRKLDKRKDLGDVIVLDQERCILCSRCVRFMEEVPGTPQLCVSQRGSHSVIETWQDRPLAGNYQGNLADVCPVGALTLKEFRFQARVWNLHKVASTCPGCSRGCSTTVEVLRKGEVKRVRPRENAAVNGWWMCDEGRFGFDAVNREGRLAGALLRSTSRGWDAVDTADALETARDMLAVHGEVLLVGSPFLTVEEGKVLVGLGKTLGTRPVFVSPEPNEWADDLLHTGDPSPNRKGLEDLGFDALPAEEILARISEGSEAVVLVGERIADSLGRDAVAGLGEHLRVILMDTHPVDSRAIDVAIGVPNYVERAGTWVNIDGHAGRIAPARQAPAGTWNLERSLDHLHTLLHTEPEGATP
ncbi:MAG: 2Fe-2S iron-sulfur cluster-binding protein [Planctomycetota bacterium]|nr:2Fe-2S iron-sulfur cluster-binding protein [Planctomycetota bacterium]